MKTAPTVPRDIIEALTPLGFSELEAEVYVFLLREAPVTGYRVAQALRRPTANTYKAIESLEAKGAVLVSTGETRRYAPVDPDELLGHIERGFEERRTRAWRELETWDSPSDDRGVYEIRSPALVFERAHSMLSMATDVAILDLFPEPARRLAAAIRACSDRGVTVAVKTYESLEMNGVLMFEHANAKTILARWRSQWVNIVIDGSEMLAANLSLDGEFVHEAVWIRSPHLSWVYHSALAAELILGSVAHGVRAGSKTEQLDSLLATHEHILTRQAPGYRRIQREISDSETRQR